MKGIIVDFDGRYAVVVNDKGDFKRVYNNFPGLQIGDEVDISKPAVPSSWTMSLSKSWGTVAAAFLIFFFVAGYTALDYLKPVTFVTLDINPSVEISLNRYSRVLDVLAINTDGVALVQDKENYRNMKIEEVIDLLLKRAISQDYLSDPDSTIMFAVSNIRDAVSPELDERLLEAAETGLKRPESETETTPEVPNMMTLNIEEPTATVISTGVKILVENTTIEKHKEAQGMNMSQGKLLMYEKLKEYKPDTKVDDIKEVSVSKILREIEELDTNKTVKGNSKKIDEKKETKMMEKQMRPDAKDEVKRLKEHEKDVKKRLEDQIKDGKKLWQEIKKDPTAVIKDGEEKDYAKKVGKSLKDEIKARQRDAKRKAKQLKEHDKQDIVDKKKGIKDRKAKDNKKN